MYNRLSIKEREQLLSLVTIEQRDFLENEVKRGRRTIFENAMRDEKISAIKSVDTALEEDEKNVVDWMIIDFFDFGLGNLGGQCACGRGLRYQFTVEHQKTGRTIQYGRDHLSTFLNIDVKDIDGVINELDKVDHELDELLWKIEHDYYGHEYYKKIPDNTVVPKIIVKHIEVNVPLLDRQINRLNKYFEKQMEAIMEEKRKIQVEIELEKRRQENDRIENLLREKKQIEDLLEAERKAHREAEIKRIQLENEYKEKLLQKKKNQEANLIKSSKEMVGYGAKLEDIAYAFVLNGVHSAVEISWIMVNNFDVDKRISISTLGRPYIYFDVLVALRQQVDNGNLIIDESSNHEDCIFYVNPYQEKHEINQSPKIQQELSLF
ncbi:hypothetical protein [Paenisporosarcina indica]|uniref:hypothetical protein n=1 Tax=Paenisporosarcina indica TaxID=650093 RepID=UPI000B0D98B1|nr:hypothetical protein [Paenisporosarcina indica]